MLETHNGAPIGAYSSSATSISDGGDDVVEVVLVAKEADSGMRNGDDR